MPLPDAGPLSDVAVTAALEAGRGALVTIAPGDTSMAPLLGTGDAVWVVPLPADPRVGEVLVFRQQEYLVVHRYLGRAVTSGGTPCLRTRGDRRNRLDPPLPPTLVRGRVAAVRRRGAWSDLSGPGARAFARAVAAHALFWAAAGNAARPVGLDRVVARIDAALLTIAVPVLFPLLHRRNPAPAPSGPSKTP